MAIALQRPLFQDKHVGIVDPKQIRSILNEIIHLMKRIRFSANGDPVVYEAFLLRKDVPGLNDQLCLECGGWDGFTRSLKEGSHLVVSFEHKDRSYYFQVKVHSIQKSSINIPFPTTLLYYPRRIVPRVRNPLQVPVTAVFLDPWTRREYLVRDVEDLSYNGLSFRIFPKDFPLLPGTKIPKLDICIFEQCSHSTPVKVIYTSLCCGYKGERFQRVGVVFDEKRNHSNHAKPFIKENECEEIVETSLIIDCLQKLVDAKTQIRFQDATRRSMQVTALPEAFLNSEKIFLSLRILSKTSLRTRFYMGQTVRILYVMHGMCYLFYTTVYGLAFSALVVRAPDSIYKIQRRRSLRSSLSACKGLRLLFRAPISDKKIVRPVLDLSEKGLSIRVDVKTNLLFPGTKIQGAELEIDGKRYSLPSIKIQDIGIHSLHKMKQGYHIRIFFEHLTEESCQAILDALLQEHHPALVRSTNRMIQDLWDLYYRSGFIYPDKQKSIQKIQKEIDKTWERLHSSETHFFQNLVFIQNEKIMGTGAILQAYDKTWLLQHLSAIKHHSILASKEVNLGLSEALMREHNIHYIKTYFRPNNPWPNKNFRDFAEQHLKPHEYDLTRYRVYHRDPSPIPDYDVFHNGVEIRRITLADREIIKNYFIRKGKVLFARSESLLGEPDEFEEISKRYMQRGLRRQRRIFVASVRGEFVCFAVAEDASFGVNLSCLLNPIRFYVVNQDREMFHAVLPSLLNCVLAFYRVLEYPKVSLMTDEQDDVRWEKWGFLHARDYYCLTFQRKSILKYLYYVREKYGKLECRLLRRVK